MKNQPSGNAPQPARRPLTRQEAAQRRARHRRRQRRRVLACAGAAALAAVLLIAVVPRLLAATAGAKAAGGVSGSAADAGAAQNSSSAPQSANLQVAGSQSAAAGSAASSAAPADSKAASSAAVSSASATAAPDADFVCTWDTTGEEGFPYLLAVNRAENCVTVFTKDTAGNYTVPYFAMVASGGEATPVGSFHTIEHYRWRFLQGDVYGQYATRITGHILFHSVPYFSQSQSDLEYDEFNKLGTAASLGCIRLQVADAKWIYDNCPIGTPTVLYDDANCPGPLGKPDFTKIDTANEALRGWDPTDPDANNPWAALGSQPTTQIPKS